MYQAAYRDVIVVLDNTGMEMITEADLVTDDIGTDLSGMQTLQRKHQSIEWDPSALENRVRTTDSEVTMLCCIRGEQHKVI